MPIESQSRLKFDSSKVFCWESPYPRLKSAKADRYYIALLNISPNAENMVFTPQIFGTFAKIIMETQFNCFSVVEVGISSPQLIQVQFAPNHSIRHLEPIWQFINENRIVDDYNQQNFQQDVLEPLKSRLEECAASLNLPVEG